MSKAAVGITVFGTVQGVGFRPFVKRLADEFHYNGMVYNSGGIVRILIVGRSEEEIAAFLRELENRLPPGAAITECKTERMEPPADDPKGFSITESDDPEPGALPLFVPDLAPCPSCLKEMSDPADRRYRYPLISCAGCGPRYTIIRAFPYDRERTTMRDYAMCPDCAAEYRENGKIRLHAQTISCHSCGPRIRLIVRDGTEIPAGVYTGDEAVRQAEVILRAGEILGCRSVGGYQLLTDPHRPAGVRRLREMKGREVKPFAVMFPATEEIRRICEVSPEEEAALESPARPIVLLKPRSADEDPGRGAGFAEGVTGRAAALGAFLPSFGALKLLADACGPLIVTSANLSEEPMITEEDAFVARFMTSEGAAAVLTHDRGILAPVDDSVVMADRAGRGLVFVRRARGYVPQPVIVPGAPGRSLSRDRTDRIGFGGDLKATLTLARGDRILVSQPFGNLEHEAVRHVFLKELDRLTSLYGIRPSEILCDAHPGYHSAFLAEEYAKQKGLPAPTRVYHHQAHVLAVMAEYGIDSAVGIAMDGTGYGEDGTIWGGEVLHISGDSCTREWHLPTLRIVGGDAASRDAALAAAALIHAEGGDLRELDLPEQKREVIEAALSQGIGITETTSTGRLFDAEACRLGIARFNHYEGECAAALEAAATRWVRQHGEDAAADPSPEARAWEFHARLADQVADAAIEAAGRTGERRIVLSGGSLINRLLSERLTARLTAAGYEVRYPHQAPPGDGGLGIGQIYYAILRDAAEEGKKNIQKSFKT